MTKKWIYGWKLLRSDLCTEYEGRETQYIAPRPGEKWGESLIHPCPASPDGQACGSGRWHVMVTKGPDARYAPTNWWPWFARGRGIVGHTDEKIGVTEIQIRRVSPEVFWRIIRWGWCSGANLSRANLEGANLSRANLGGANLFRANLYGANLEGANLGGANLSRANLSRANLFRASLSRANLYGANLYGANLSRANLGGANLDGANLSRANLDGANLEGANLRGTNLEGANLDGANACNHTEWSTNFDPKAVGIIAVED